MRTFLASILIGLIGFAVARFSAPSRAHVNRNAAVVSAPVDQTAVEVSPAAVTTPPRDRARTPGERLDDAFFKRSLLRGVGEAVAVIDSMTAEDFREFSKASGPSLSPGGYGDDDDINIGFMDALIARWIEVDADGALAGIREKESQLIHGRGRMVDAGQYLAAYARLRPRELLEEMPEGVTWDVFDGTIRAAFRAMGERDATGARGYLDRITDPKLRNHAKAAIAIGVAKNDPLTAVSLAHEMNDRSVLEAALEAAERIGPGVFRQVLAANNGRIFEHIRWTEMVLRHPDEDFGFLAGKLPDQVMGATIEAVSQATRLSTEARQHRLDRLDEFPPGVREHVESALMQGWSRREPREAVEWALAHAKPEDVDAPETRRVQTGFYAMMGNDLAGTETWVSRLPASALRDQLGNTLAAAYAREGDLQKARALFSPGVGDKAAGAASAIAAARAKDDPFGAAEWLLSMPREADMSKAIKPVIASWIDRDATAAARWIEARPNGPLREEGLKAFAQAAAGTDPVAASAWVTVIRDSETRRQAAEAVLRQWNRTDPGAAEEWLRSLPDVDEGWRNHLLRERP